MHALTFRGKENVIYERIADPEITEPTDVIIRTSLCAICGSDLHVYHEHEKGLDHGTAMGHEFIGAVVEAGSAVRKLKRGMKVLSPFTTNCGQCYFCTIGLTCRCVHSQLFGWRQNQHGLHGGQAEFVRVPLADHTLLPVPENVTDEEALFAGDIMSTGFYSALRAEVTPAGSYAVVGCGPVGLMAILGAREFGAERIYAIDMVEERLLLAKKFGAVPIDGRGDVPALIRELTNGIGVDAVLEAVGNPSSFALSYSILRPGGIISSVGVCTDSSFGFSPIQAYDKNVTFKTGRCPARYMIDRLLPVLQAKKYPVAEIISHRLTLSDGPRGYDLFAGKKDNCLKVVMTI